MIEWRLIQMHCQRNRKFRKNKQGRREIDKEIPKIIVQSPEKENSYTILRLSVINPELILLRDTLVSRLTLNTLMKTIWN